MYVPDYNKPYPLSDETGIPQWGDVDDYIDDINSGDFDDETQEKESGDA